MNKDFVNKVVGNGSFKNASRDSDGDKVSDILDCQPYNAKEQGVIHKIGSAIARKVGADETAEKIEAREYCNLHGLWKS